MVLEQNIFQTEANIPACVAYCLKGKSQKQQNFIKHASVLNFKFETIPHPHLGFLLLHLRTGNLRKEVHTPAESRTERNISQQWNYNLQSCHHNKY